MKISLDEVWIVDTRDDTLAQWITNPRFACEYIKNDTLAMMGHIHRYFNVTNRDRQWGFYVTSAGHAVTKPRQAYPPEPHPRGYDFNWERGRRLDEFGLIYLISGRGLFESSHQPPTVVQANCAWFLFPGEWHRYRPDYDIGWEEYWVTFGGSMPEKWRKENLLNLCCPLISSGIGLSLASTFEELLRIVPVRRPNASFLMTGLCHLLVGRALSALHPIPQLATTEQHILEAADHLRFHADQPVDLPALARRSAMSYSAFRQTFKKHIGVPPHRFHQQARIVLVKEMLEQTNLPLKKVAEQFNYPSEFYLMQTFKRHTGLTPTEWRKGHKA